MDEELRSDTETTTTSGSRWLFEPAVLLPSQLTHRHPLSHMGELKLVTALMESARFELERADRCRKEKDFDNIQQLRRWVLSDNSEYIFSFVNLCMILLLDVDATRRMLLRVDGRVRPSFAWDDRCPVRWEDAPHCIEIRDGIAGYTVIFRTPEARYELRARFFRSMYAQKYAQQIIEEYRLIANQGGAHGCPR